MVRLLTKKARIIFPGEKEMLECRSFASDYERQPKTTRKFALLHEYVKRVRAECPNMCRLAENYLLEIEGKLTRVQVGAKFDHDANVLVVSVKCTCGDYPLASVGVIKVHTGI